MTWRPAVSCEVIRFLQHLHLLKGALQMMIANISSVRLEAMTILGIDDVDDPRVIKFTEAINKLQELAGDMDA